MPTVAGLVLAAGAGRRFGQPKALVPLIGELLVERACRTLRAGGCDPVFVVLGAAADEVRSRASLSHVTVLENPDWADGMGSSLRTGLAAAAERSSVAAIVILPVDMPGISAESVSRVATYAHTNALVAAAYDHQRGHPVLIGRDHWPGVNATASGDVGARDYLRTRNVMLVSCEDISDSHDVDRPADLPTE